MHGDYEAQRHWMEIAAHLPMSQWYFYDLQYWGLDYPPLTAYHSWVFGKIGSFINPTWFALYSSRGIEEQLLKVYMRATVIISEYLLYIPPIVTGNFILGKLENVTSWESSIALVGILMQPATILIDHAHFQYNTVMLGFVAATVSTLLSENFAFASIFFVLALSFKQMALYYAPAIFFYLFGISLSPSFRPLRLLSIAIMTILSFALVVLPLVVGTFYDQRRGINPPLDRSDRQINPLFSTFSPYINPSSIYYPYILQLSQLLHRVFPFARGIFEDKVANLWCCIHLVHKLHNYPTALLQRLSLLTTLVAIQPACMLISLFPRRNLILWALASTSWGFFLWSFQVHEKSVLLPLLPMTLLLGGQGGLGVELRAWIGFANLLGTWTLFPLLKRDELRVPYFVLTLLWAYLLGLPPTSFSCYFGPQAAKGGLKPLTKLLHLLFYTVMIGWHIVEATQQPPPGKPDLWVVLNVVIGAIGFGVCYLWCTWQTILRSGVLEEWFGYRAEQEGKSLEDRAKALPLPWPLSKAKDSVAEKTSSEKDAVARKEKSPSPTERRKTRGKKKS
ncbi:uncharacterized protein KY384_004051 [Bacidia gigantensis]|uniref:uncharacterized protein n=1 Tax=Bacidia gigantensis TaxID=2732470 RepID=UPI001D04D296|nr:uncharacterized protein KY384_004051 [Bacidia gigantensis]KAG8530696.1 hypothetical protein KY384_004051 [Bacidia gigantensis]